MVNREIGGDQRECAGTALLWALDEKQESELECSPEGTAESDEFFQDKGEWSFPG